MKEMKWIVLSSCLLFTMFIGHGRACEPGVFGLNCTNQCHCRSGECTEFGACEDGCEDGWGGIHCNYHVFDNANIFFQDSSGMTVKPNFLRKIVDGYNVYLIGSMDRRFKTIKIKFKKRASKKYFCGMFVSGGRNVAFKQPVSFNTVQGGHGAERAVDGVKDNGLCASTQAGRYAWLQLKSRLPIDVNYIEIYNSDVLSCRLKYFRLWLAKKYRPYWDTIETVERYSDSQRETQMVYKVPVTTFKPIDYIALIVDRTFWVNESRSSCGDSPHENVLTVCEVEVYGEVRCPVGRYGYDCEKRCDSNCVLGCQVETGYCNKCEEGRSGAFCQISDFVGTACEPGVFGLNCTNQCHCRFGNCTALGKCTAHICKDGWGGIHCSYRDAAFDEMSPLTDNALYTCLDSSPNPLYIFRMREETKLTWIRFNLKKEDVFDNDEDVEISFEDSSNETVIPTFLRKIVDGYTVDLIGSMDRKFKYIKLVFKDLENKQFFCGMFVSGGRNVAFKQPVSLKTQWRGNRGAERAVDGIRDAYYCVYTRAGGPALFSVTPILPIDVNFIEIYTGHDQPCKLRFYKMFLNSGADWNSTVQEHYDNQFEPQNTYKVLATTFGPIRRIWLAAEASYDWVKGKQVNLCRNWLYPNRLFICELEIYGEVRCPVGQYGYDCEKRCDSDCVSGCHVETGYCNKCAKRRSGRYCEIF